jgi:hypothetical protein
MPVILSTLDIKQTLPYYGNYDKQDYCVICLSFGKRIKHRHFSSMFYWNSQRRKNKEYFKCLTCGTIHDIPKPNSPQYLMFGSSTLFGLENMNNGYFHIDHDFVCGATFKTLQEIWNHIYAQHTNYIYNVIICCGLNDIPRFSLPNIKEQVLQLKDSILKVNNQNTVSFVQLFKPPSLCCVPGQTDYSDTIDQLNLFFRQISNDFISISRYGLRQRRNRYYHRYSYFREYQFSKYRTHLEKIQHCLHLREDIRCLAYGKVFQRLYNKYITEQNIHLRDAHT